MSTSRPLTIGIDARAAEEVPAGRGRVVRELLRALAARKGDRHRYLLLTRAARRAAAPRASGGAGGRAWEDALDERFRRRAIPGRDPVWHLRAARAANRECDVFLSSNSYLTALFLRIPCVPIVYDMTTFEPSMRPNRRSTVIERLTLGSAVRRSGALLAISKSTADALASQFPTAAGRTVVAPLGVSPSIARAPDGERTATLPSPGFVLAVGTLEPRKNLPRLVDAYSRLSPELQERHPLVVVGALGWETGETLGALRSLGGRCTMLGYVSDSALAELYRRCAVFCYPSLGEGFGLPVLEAMATGAAVLTSNVSSLPEVGGDAVEYVNPHDVASIAAGLRGLLEDESRRARLSQLAVSRARHFTWADFAERVLNTLEDAADGAAPGGYRR